MPPYTAKTADPRKLYVESVQNPEYEAKNVARFYKTLRGKQPLSMKEDFCASFLFCCEWVKGNKERTAIGVDFEPKILKYGRKHHLPELTDSQQKRITLINDDVLNVTKPKVDLVCAFNFSYFIFKTRESLRAYFKAAHKSLKSDGVFMLDAFGGSESYLVQEERRKCAGFTYVWEHADYNPINGDILCKIHFEFKDGTKLRNAFKYDWRLWTLPEIKELLLEAGFKSTDIYWEGTDSETGEGNGVYRKTTKGEACNSWVAYIVAAK
jgi:hypothetical protein